MLPLGVFGAVVATSARGLPNDVYFQIGFLTTLGLSTKNAILIIQFIKDQMRQGDGLIEPRAYKMNPAPRSSLRAGFLICRKGALPVKGA